MKRQLTGGFLLFLMILFIGSTVTAQGRFGRGFGDPRQRGLGNFDKRGMHKKNLENLRLLKLLEVLDLEDDQNDQFISAFSKFRKKSKSIREDIEHEITSLAEYLGWENKSDNVIMEKVDLIAKIKDNFEKERRKFFEKIKGILTAEQLGRMMVFQERFERELLEQVRGLRAPKAPDMRTPAPAPDIMPIPDIREIDN